MATIGTGARRSAAGLSIALHLVVLLLLFTVWGPFFPIDSPVIERPLQIVLEPLAMVEPPETTPVDREMPAARPKYLQNVARSRGSPAAIANTQPVATHDLIAAAPTIISGTARTGIEGSDSTIGNEQGVDTGSGSEIARGGGSGSRGSEWDSPDWIVKPTAEQMVEALPQRAKQARISGGALLSCLVTPGKRVRACKVLNETQGRYAFGPPYEFGRAALRLSRHFRIRPPLRDGQPRYDIRVRIPVYWETL